MTGGSAPWCGTAADLGSCCWGTQPVPASPMATGPPSPPASGSACEVGLRSVRGTSLGGALHLAAPRPTWEPSSNVAASRSRAVSPSIPAGPAGSCAAMSASVTAMPHVVSPDSGSSPLPPLDRVGPPRAGPMRREASTLDICFPSSMSPLLFSFPKLHPFQGCHLRGEEMFWTQFLVGLPSCLAPSHDSPVAGDAL